MYVAVNVMMDPNIRQTAWARYFSLFSAALPRAALTTSSLYLALISWHAHEMAPFSAPRIQNLEIHSWSARCVNFSSKIAQVSKDILQNSSRFDDITVSRCNWSTIIMVMKR